MARTWTVIAGVAGTALAGAILVGQPGTVLGQESPLEFFMNQARPAPSRRVVVREVPAFFGLFGPTIRVTRPVDDDYPDQRRYGDRAVPRELVRLVCVRACDNARLALAIQPAHANRDALEDMCQAAGRGTRTELIAEPFGADRAPVAGMAGPRTASLDGAAMPASNYCPAHITAAGFQVPLTDDVTLRRGDIVMTEDGLRVFVGRGAPPFRNSDFVATHSPDAKMVDAHRPGGEPHRRPVRPR